VTPSGACIHYNLSSFVQYLTVTRDFTDPVTRLPLQIDDLERIQLKILTSGLQLPNVLELYQQPKPVEAHSDVRSIEACLGELITDMLKLIERRRPSRDDQEYRLLVIFSEFEIPFHEFKSLNLEAAYHALASWISLLRGPPKKPTRDPSALLSRAVAHLRGQWTDKDSEQLQMIRGDGSHPIAL
jgi:hypothetical protein